MWSMQGQLVYSTTNRPANWNWKLTISQLRGWREPRWISPEWGWKVDQQSTSVYFPHLFLVLVTGGLAAFPWLRLHFSLRTLLILTMLIAVIVWILTLF